MAWVFLVLSSVLAFGTRGSPFSNHALIFFFGLALFINGYLTKTLSKYLSLFTIAFVVGTVGEIIYLNSGSYFYFAKGVELFNVPLQVSLFWGNFYYLSHLLANRISKRYLYFIDAAIMVGIDLLLDPVMVRLGAWKWKDGGAYFGIPTANFVGWFLVSLLISVLVRKVFKIKILDKNSFGLVSLAIVLTYLVLMFGRNA